MSLATRRRFLEDSLIAATAALGAPVLLAAAREPRRPAGPNERLRVCVAGIRERGAVHVDKFLEFPDVEVAAVCDVDENVAGPVIQRVESRQGRRPLYHKDLRKLLDEKSIDAVSIATCNHTHALLAIWSVLADKDVYVEKPLSHNVWEGRRLVEAARKRGRIVAHGTQGRSSGAYREGIEFLHAGKLGRIKIARGLCYKRRGSIRKQPDGPVPAGVDYDLWLGPAPLRPFNPNRFHSNWNWLWDTGDGDIGNQGVHQMDVCRWGLKRQDLPRSVASAGGRLGYADDGETPNTQVAVLDYGDAIILFEVRGLGTDPYMQGVRIGVLFHGERGYGVFSGGAAAYDLTGKLIQRFGGGDGDHFRNFVDAVKARRSDLLRADALEGHLSSALCHLANISYRLGQARSFDGLEPFGNDPANEAFLRMREHLKGNGLDLSTLTCRQGRTLSVEPGREALAGDPEANALLRPDYRKPFALPQDA